MNRLRRLAKSPAGTTTLEFGIAALVIFSITNVVIDASWFLHRYSILTEASASIARATSVRFNSRFGTGMNCTQLACEARNIINNFRAHSPHAQQMSFTVSANGGESPLSPYPYVAIEARTTSSCLLCALMPASPRLQVSSVVIVEKDNTHCDIGESSAC